MPRPAIHGRGRAAVTLAERRALVDAWLLLSRYDRLLLASRADAATHRELAHAAIHRLAEAERENKALRQRLQSGTDGWACPHCNGVPRKAE